MREREQTENREQAHIISRKSIFFRIILFALAACVIFLVLGNVFEEKYINAVDGPDGFYEIPEDTIQMIVVGASVAGCGISTPQLYEDYGICAYTLGFSWQPVLASYYWVEEAYALHSDTLTTVVLDVASMTRTSEEMKYYKASIDTMRFSVNKIKAVRAYTDSVNDLIANLFPLLYYHDRWAGELTQSDLKFYEDETENVLGYEFFTSRYIDLEEWDEMGCVTGVYDESQEPTTLGEDSLEYLDRMVTFCEENGLELILIKTPKSGWRSGSHTAVQEVADEYDLTFLDFSFGELWDALDVNTASDTYDGKHLNYYGAQKLTAYLGAWLTENTQVSDIRDDEDYAFMEEELEKYKVRNEMVMDLAEATDAAEYLSVAMENEDNEIFIVARGDINDNMTQELRDAFAQMGLTILSEQTHGDSYIGIIDGGSVIYEDTISFDQDDYDSVMQSGESWSYETLQYSLKTDGCSVTIKSGGEYLGAVASVVIGGTEYAQNTRGLNIVVYNKSEGKVMDSVVFDLHASASRESYNLEEALAQAQEEGTAFANLSDTLQDYIRYNKRAERLTVAAQTDLEAGDDGLLIWLQTYLSMEDVSVFLSVQGDAASSLTDEARSYLASLGLTGLSELTSQNSYIGYIVDGEVIYEECEQDGTAIGYSGMYFAMESSAQASSIRIDDTEYAGSDSGIHVVAYDTEYGFVIDSSDFDTAAVECRIPDQTD